MTRTREENAADLAFEDDACRSCGAAYDEGGDGYDGECAGCADASYMNELVDRSAPRWAWDIIDETLAMDAESKAFDASLRASIAAANLAMIRASETDDKPISRADIDTLMEVESD